ncbi:MAG: saccharopine dehydrogenase [Nitrospinaceae bacterium]|nr:MAG: saccharopine dehydrogenase [Nitrospinaceae bacterium]
MSYRYAIIGTGRQGLSAAYDMGRFGDAEEILLYDIDDSVAKAGAEKINGLLNSNIARGIGLDAANPSELRKALKGVHSTLSAVPYPLNPLITRIAVECGSNLCDLGGHTETVREQLNLDPEARKAGVTITPDCGMGPGLNISMGVLAMSFVENPEDVLIWDGGLPQNPEPPWNYLLTFNINGFTNEYYGDAHFLRDGKVVPVACLSELETLEFPSPLGKLEAAVTSGGLSTAPWTFSGKLKRLENKTLRYPGHWAQFKAFQQLGLFEENPIPVNGATISPREVFHSLLEPKITAEKIRDICVIRTRCNGTTDGKPASCTLELIETYDEGTQFTAMEKLTGWHASIVAILSARGDIPKGGIPVETALTAEALRREGALRGWEFKNKTVLAV